MIGPKKACGTMSRVGDFQRVDVGRGVSLKQKSEIELK